MRCGAVSSATRWAIASTSLGSRVTAPPSRSPRTLRRPKVSALVVRIRASDNCDFAANGASRMSSTETVVAAETWASSRCGTHARPTLSSNTSGRALGRTGLKAPDPREDRRVTIGCVYRTCAHLHVAAPPAASVTARRFLARLTRHGTADFARRPYSRLCVLEHAGDHRHALPEPT